MGKAINRPVVKICCISSLEEAMMAIRYGAGSIGLVSEMPSGPGVIDEELITEIAARTPRQISTFLLTSLQGVDEIVAQHRRVRTSTIQLVDELVSGSYADLRRQLPGISIVQVIHVQDDGAIKEAERISRDVDFLLLDSGNKSLPTKELGGTGRTHDWSISRRIIERSKVPVFLAGGLNAENVAEAVRSVRPYGLDLCSGVRKEGQLSEEKLKQFFASLASFK